MNANDTDETDATEADSTTTTTTSTTKAKGSWDYLMSLPFNVVQSEQEKAFIHELAKELYRQNPQGWGWDINDVLNTSLALNLDWNEETPTFHSVAALLGRMLPERRFTPFGIWELKPACGVAFMIRPHKRYAKKY